MCINEWQLALGYEADIFPWTIVFDEKWNESQQTYLKIKERVTFLSEYPKIVSNTKDLALAGAVMGVPENLELRLLFNPE